MRFSRGYFGLVGVLALSIIGGIVVTALLLKAIDQQRASMEVMQRAQAELLSEQCLEDALQAMTQTFSFTGSGNISQSGGSCTYTVTGAALPKTILVNTTYGNYTLGVQFVLSETGVVRTEL